MRNKTLIFVIGYLLYVPGVFLALAAGVTVADKYVDTASNPLPGWLMIVILAAVIGGPAAVFSLTWNRPNRWQRALQQGGRQALARIVDVADTGVSSGAGLTIYVRLTLEVHPDGETPFPAKLEVANSRVNIMRPGGVIPVRYDPLNHDHVVYDDSPAAEPEIGSPWEQEPSTNAARSPAEAVRMLEGMLSSPPARDDTGRANLAGELAQLDALHQRGALTDAEYAAAKAKLLA